MEKFLISFYKQAPLVLASIQMAVRSINAELHGWKIFLQKWF